MKKTMLLCFLVTLAVCPRNTFAEKQNSAIDYIGQTHKLWGISSCAINREGSVTFVDRKSKGEGFALWIPDGNGGSLDKITLKAGDSFELIDGDHAFITYKFVALIGANIVIEVLEKFDARSFGGKVEQETKQMMVLPYQDDQ